MATSCLADLGGDLVDAEAGAGSEAHGSVRELLDYIERPTRGVQRAAFQERAKAVPDCP